jgi:hypothetical protein
MKLTPCREERKSINKDYAMKNIEKNLWRLFFFLLVLVIYILIPR